MKDPSDCSDTINKNRIQELREKFRNDTISFLEDAERKGFQAECRVILTRRDGKAFLLYDNTTDNEMQLFEAENLARYQLESFISNNNMKQIVDRTSSTVSPAMINDMKDNFINKMLQLVPIDEFMYKSHRRSNRDIADIIVSLHLKIF